MKLRQMVEVKGKIYKSVKSDSTSKMEDLGENTPVNKFGKCDIKY